MKIQNQQLRKLNITALFDKIDQSQISGDLIRDALNLSPKDRSTTPFIELPGTKVLAIPTQRKEIVIEPNRLLVNDSSVKDPSKSTIISDFEVVYKAFSGKSRLIAYGFNYDIFLELSEDIQFKSFLSPRLAKLLNGGTIIEAGARVIYNKGGRRFDIQVVPGGKQNQLVIHANTHHELDKIHFKTLAKELSTDYKEIKQATQRFTEG